MLRLLWHGVCGVLHRADNILVSSATANIAIQSMADLLISRMGIAVQQIHHRDDHTGCAETTLQAVLLTKGILYRMQITIGGDAFNGSNTATICLYCQYCTGFDGNTIHQHGACTALTGITTHISARQSNYFAQEMREQ